MPPRGAIPSARTRYIRYDSANYPGRGAKHIRDSSTSMHSAWRIDSTSMSEPVLVLWDIDGTLIRSGEVAAAVFEWALATVIGVPPQARVKMSGKTDPQIVQEYLDAMGISNPTVLPDILAHAEAELAKAEHLLAEQGYICPGVIEVMERLHQNPDVTQTVLTGNIEPNAKVKLRAFGLDRFIDFEIGAYGSDHAERTKLVPIALERAKVIRALRVDTGSVWVIGDTPHDLACARAGGVRCLLVATGSYELDELELLQPDAAVKDLSDLSGVLGVLDVA